MNDNSTPANPGRRRLTKGGLAMPVVLATLSSKNAFAALPYHCFVSGQLSNNLSPFGPNARTAQDACTLPLSRSAVQTSLQNDQTTFASIFSINIYVNNTKQLTLGAGTNKNSNPAATLFQVLTLATADGINRVGLLDTLQKGVVLYRNAMQYPPPNDHVPLTSTQIISLTRAAYLNSSYTVVTSIGSKTYNAGDIQAYFTQLSA